MTLFHAAARPAFSPDPSDPAGPAARARHRRDVLRAARYLLGVEERGGAALPALVRRRSGEGATWTSS
jgi:hypothetical protein